MKSMQGCMDARAAPLHHRSMLQQSHRPRTNSPSRSRNGRRPPSPPLSAHTAKKPSAETEHRARLSPYPPSLANLRTSKAGRAIELVRPILALAALPAREAGQLGGGTAGESTKSTAPPSGCSPQLPAGSESSKGLTNLPRSSRNA